MLGKRSRYRPGKSLQISPVKEPAILPGEEDSRPLRDAQHSSGRKYLLGCLAILGLCILAVLSLPYVAHRMANAPTVVCQNNMRQIVLAAIFWAHEKDTNILPFDVLTFTNELYTPKILHCPSDKGHGAATSWQAYTASNNSYIISPGIQAGNESAIYIRCPFHGTVGTVDGKVMIRASWPSG